MPVYSSYLDVNVHSTRDTCFDVFECTNDIGLNPDDQIDVEIVDSILQWNALKTIQYMVNIFDENT